MKVWLWVLRDSDWGVTTFKTTHPSSRQIGHPIIKTANVLWQFTWKTKKTWSRLTYGGLIPGQSGRLTVGSKITMRWIWRYCNMWKSSFKSGVWIFSVDRECSCWELLGCQLLWLWIGDSPGTYESRYRWLVRRVDWEEIPAYSIGMWTGPIHELMLVVVTSCKYPIIQITYSNPKNVHKPRVLMPFKELCFMDVTWRNTNQYFSWSMASSGMLLRVALVRIDVSEEHIASIIKMTRIGELGTLA
jgi:hypothetical protein